MASAPDWTEAEDEWLREFYPLYPNAELERMKADDGWPRDAEAICRRAKRLGVRKDPTRGYVRKCRHPSMWTPERDEWFRSFVPDHSEGEISAEHERLFGFPLTRSQVKNRKQALGVLSGTHGGRFEPGHVPANKGMTWDEFGTPEGHARSRATCFAKGSVNGAAAERLQPLLHVRETEYGREIKVDPRDKKHPMKAWVPLGAFNWMAANGREWPEGCKCAHADHDPWNDDAENIVPVPSELWLIVNGAVPGGLPWHDRATLEVAIVSARVTRARAAKQREARIAAGRPWKCDMERKEG